MPTPHHPSPPPMPQHLALLRDAQRAEQALHRAQALRWRRLANEALTAGDPVGALRAWREVGKREPGALDVLFNLGCCHALNHEPQRACLVFDALADSPQAPAALRQRAARLAALLAPAVATEH